MAARLLLFAILLPLLSTDAPAQSAEREAGFPYLRNYLPNEFGAQEQNWAVTQDPRGVVYIGNNDGVLIYDGVHWQRIRVANGSAVRSLDVDESGTVYVGARGDFGYLAAGDSGAPSYVSLVDSVPAADRGFKDVWRTIVTPEGVVFTTFQQIFRYRPQTGITSWKPSKRFYFAFPANHAVYVQDASTGLLRLNGDSLRPEPGGSRFANDQMIYCVSFQDDRLLVSSQEGMFLREDGVFKPHPTEADALLRDAKPYSCSALAGGGLAISTLRGGVIQLSPESKLERVLNETSGLPSNTVTFSYPDREGGLWITHIAGVTRALTPGPLSFFNGRTGIKGFVAALARQQDSFYAGASSGLYRLAPSAAGETARFEPIPGINQTVFALLSTETGLLAGAADGVYRHQSSGSSWVRRNTGQAVYDLTRSSKDPALVYVSGADGLALLRLKDGRWSDAGAVPAVRQSLRKAVESGGSLWLGTDYSGALHVTGLPDAPVVESFGAKEGLQAGWLYPFSVAGRTVFLSEAGGILSFDEKTRRFSPDSLLAKPFAGRPDKPSVLHEDSQGNIWVGANTYSGLLRRRANGTYMLDESPLRRMDSSEIQTIHLDADGVTWAGTANGIVRYNPDFRKNYAKNYAVAFPALIRRVGSIDGKFLAYGGVGPAEALLLSYDHNSLRFQFAAPSFEDETRTEYRSYLEGFDRDWTAWSRETRKDYTNLPEGGFTFRVEARNLYGAVSREGSYTFRVNPPWYRTWWGYGLEILAVAALLWLVVRWRLSQLAEQNRHLQEIVEERTAELRERNGELTEANEALNRLNSEKNEFLGIAAHDLKNPLGAIRGYAEMLEEDANDIPSDEVVDFAGKIKKSANLMFDLVSNLLDVNRIEQGRMDLDLKPCDLWEIVRQAVDGYRVRAQAKQIEMHFDERSRPPLVMADGAQLVQIMDNLVSNAVKYSPKARNIFVRVREIEGRVRAEVQDEGPGISAEDRKRLFGKFARLTARPTAGENSTGLGLAIVKRLVESMEGKVWCESEPGLGATFVVELPVAVEVSPQPAEFRL